MTARRHTDKPHLEPGSVWGLDPAHPAMRGNRTIFPSTVVDVTGDAPDRLLVSGQNSRKLGKTVSKGRLAGYALYGLTLEERATCPDACSVRDVCYGNGMHLARRHRIGDPAVFEARLDEEIDGLLAEHGHGILVRLHVLGDFPSAAYVGMWGRLLDAHPRLACYGYTHRLPARVGGCAIGDAVEATKRRHPERFRIRWSADAPMPDGAVVIGEVPEAARVPEGIVCPAQTDATACCASCGLCWEPSAAGQTIAFVRHGKTTAVRAAHAAMAAIDDARRDTTEAGTRRVTPLRMPANMRPGKVAGSPPTFESVDPRTLLVEERYQRDLGPASVRLIRRMVTGWDWSKFKPPVCARTPSGLYVIDGQHTSIGAATHPDVAEIPVMVIPAADVEARARSFVAHNRDRVPMSELAILAAEAAAGVPRALAVHDAIVAGGGQVPRVQPLKGHALPGDVIAIGAARRVHGALGPGHLERIVRLAVAAGCRPIDSTVIIGLHHFLADPRNAGVDEADVARALGGLSEAGDMALAGTRKAAADSLGSRYKGLAALLSMSVPATSPVAVSAKAPRPSPPAGTATPLPVARPRRPRVAPSQFGTPPMREAHFDWTEEHMAMLLRRAAREGSAE